LYVHGLSCSVILMAKMAAVLHTKWRLCSTQLIKKPGPTLLPSFHLNQNRKRYLAPHISFFIPAFLMMSHYTLFPLFASLSSNVEFLSFFF
jgi:hypothetical protein